MYDLDCGSCGQTFNACRLNGLAYDGDEFLCTDCGAVNAIGVDEDGEDVDVYVMFWRCEHGGDNETACGECRPDSPNAAVRERAEVIIEER